MDNTLLILTQSGAVGVSLAAFYLIYRLVAFNMQRTDCIIEKNSQAIERHSEVISSLQKVIEERLP